MREEDFDHELQQMSSSFSSDLHEFKLETQLKTLTHIADKKQVKIKDDITITSSLNASPKLLVSEVLKGCVRNIFASLFFMSKRYHL